MILSALVEELKAGDGVRDEIQLLQEENLSLYLSVLIADVVDHDADIE